MNGAECTNLLWKLHLVYQRECIRRICFTESLNKVDQNEGYPPKLLNPNARTHNTVEEPGLLLTQHQEDSAG